MLFSRSVPIQTNRGVYHTLQSEEFEDTTPLVPFFKEILPSELNLSEGFVPISEGFIPISEGYISTSPVILELSDSTEYCQCG
jgi:hypothetical protein